MVNHLAVLELVKRFDVWDLPGWLADGWGALRRRRREGRTMGALAALPPPAKALLRQFLERETRTLHVASVAGAAIGLELADVISISREPELAATSSAFLLRINPGAWEQLRRHPELLA